MILIIFGAGASFDSLPSRPPSLFPRDTMPDRMPLASELFLDEGIFQKALARFPRCKPIVPYLQNPSSRSNIETTLEGLQAETETYPERIHQLAAVRYYLHYVIWECEQAWNKITSGVTNYVTLLDQVRKSLKANETVSIVSFNYDRMIEDALETVGVKITKLPDYIRHGTFKLYKLHGSVHWGRIIYQPRDFHPLMNAWETVDHVVQHADKLELTDQFRLVNEHPMRNQDDDYLFPALAMPVQEKSEFECPVAHLKSLKNALPHITKAIVVGWKAADLHFLRLLKGLLKPDLPVCVVSENRTAATKVVKQFFRSGIRITAKPIDGGFTDFILSREAESFLRSY